VREWGAHVVRSLLQRGYQVTAFVRPNSDRRGLEGLNLDYCFGDIMDRAALTAACGGCEAAIHTAAVYRTWAKNHADIFQLALVRTRNILEAARETGLQRVVYTSSIAALGFAIHPNQPRTENDWQNDAHTPYTFAKTKSEQEAVRLAKQYKVPLIRICPTMVIGPRDYRITPSMSFIAEMVNDGMFFEGGQNIVDIRHVGELHAAALEKGEPGGRYIGGGCNLHQRDFAEILGRLTGITPKYYPNSRAMLLMAAWLMEKTAVLSRKEPALSFDVAHESINRYAYVDSTFTANTFSLATRPVEETLRDAVRWLLYMDKIKKQIPEQLLEALQPDPAWQKYNWPKVT
jgi:dihydroflavonol-4-reductase